MAEPLNTWNWRNPIPTGNQLNGVGSGAGGYVAVGDLGTIVVSRNALDWMNVESGTVNSLRAVANGNGLWVAVGDFGQILTSSDGAQWTSQSNGYFFNLTGVAWGNGLFVAVGENTSILTSPDGLTWTLRTMGTDPLLGVTWGGGSFVAVGGTPPSGAGGRIPGKPLILVSTDGVHWNYRDVPVDGQASCVAFGNGRFVAGTTSQTTITSTDGDEWLPGFESAGFSGYGILSVAYIAHHFVANYGSASTIPGSCLVSLDGLLWTTEPIVVSRGGYIGNILSLTDGPSGVVGVAHGLAYDLHNYLVGSTNGQVWSDAISHLPAFESPVAFAGDRFFLREQSGYTNPFQPQPDTTYLMSWDAQKWERVEASATQRFELPAYGNGLWVAAGAGGGVIVSTNAINWNEAPTGNTNLLTRSAFAGGLFLATGANGTLLISSNGMDWSRGLIDSSNSLGDVAWSGGVYVVAESGSTNLFTSTDTMIWSRRSMPAGYQVVRSLKAWEEGFALMVAVSEYGPGELLRSTDGVNWQVDPLPANDIASLAVGGGRLIVFREAGSRLFNVRNAGQTNWTAGVLPWVARFQGVYYDAPAGIAFGQNTFLLTHSLGFILQSDPLTDAAPRITRPLNAVSPTPNSPVSLRVGVEGSSPLKYQWKLNGTNLPLGNLPSLTLRADVISTNTVTVAVSNAHGTNESGRAVVAFSVAPTLAITSDGTSMVLSGTPGGRYEIESEVDSGLSNWSFFGEIELPSFESAGRVKNLRATWPPDAQRLFRAKTVP